MSNTLAERFIEALNVLESNRDAEPITALFADNAEIGNVLAPDKFHGAAGARHFWTKYRDTFEILRSTFRNTIVQSDRIALEWNTQGASTEGNRVEYDGVSILEIADGRIDRFRAYFDPANLGRQLEGQESIKD